MKFDPSKHRRRSIRLSGYDYTCPGAYFVTICTWQRECTFGVVEGGEMRLTPTGQIAKREWARLGRRFPSADFSAFVIMPNHVHGIIVLYDPDGRGAGGGSKSLDPSNSYLRPYVAPGSLGAIVRAYKASVTWRIHAQAGDAGTPVWQRNYFEHIIRDDKDLELIYTYIENNPSRWELDQLHPEAAPNPFKYERRG